MLFIAHIVLTAVGLVAILAANWLNRGKIIKFEQARTVARDHLIVISEGQSLDAVLQDIGLSPFEFGSGKRVLQVLPKTFGLVDVVPPANLALSDVLRIRVPASIDEIKELHVIPIKYIEPFSCDLIENLLSIVDKRLWNERLIMDKAFPVTEEALINLVTTMTVESFVRYFAPLVRS